MLTALKWTFALWVLATFCGFAIPAYVIAMPVLAVVAVVALVVLIERLW